jgi:metal-responsive CopG/Arc/MetJ family transcriptional regulator
MYMQVQTVNITLPKQVVSQADLVAEDEFKTRSELIKDALILYLRDKRVWGELFTYGQKIGKRMEIKNETDVARILDSYRNGK